MSNTIPDTIDKLNDRLRVLENRFYELGYDMTAIAQSEYKKKFKIQPQSQTSFGLFTALCVDTIDPWKQNCVRFFSPLFHKPDTPIKSLPWAYPISAAGGFDDCGMSWVPPAGSTLCISFENGSRQTPFYHGTTWHRDRGPDGQHNWNYNIKEYYDIHEGHRKGYLVGPNDGSQVFPQWNTQNYNGFDIDSIADFENDPDAKRKITYPHIYGFKTPQKHMIKKDDGDYKCNHKGKKIEVLSSTGIWVCLKDDHLHNADIVAHPSCVSGPVLDCADEQGNPVETPECGGDILGGHPSTPRGTTYGLDSNKGSSPYFKHANECRPYKGPGTPQNNKAELPQSGFQVLTRSGQSFIMDDSVEEPRGVPNHERGSEPFDFGCNDKFLGKIMIISALGQRFEMSDVEQDTGVRGDKTYMRMKSSTSNLIEINDQMTNKRITGEKNGITMQTNCLHLFQMLGEDNELEPPERREGATPKAKAKKAFIRMRSGYGIEFSIKDQSSQEETQNQFLQIFCPQQKNGQGNTERGPHIMRFQERAQGPGFVFLRVGGDYICSTHDNHYTFVGDKDKNPSNLVEYVSKNNVVFTEGFYFNVADIHAFMAEQLILLMAGKDCPPPDGGEAGPCVWPVLCWSNKGIVASDRVYASASPDSPCCSILDLLPFHSCSSGNE